jgi:dipeptidyl aminopeptidase/acylaminoacyl peptidase
MRKRVLTAVTLLVVAAALGDRAAAQGGAERIAFSWCYADWGYSEGGLVCRIAAVDPDAPSEPSPDGSPPANWMWLTEGFGPAWSPDGTKIAFSGTHPFAGAGSADVAVLNLADGTLADAANRSTWWDAWVPSPAWSPDGSRIAFASDRDGTLELYVMHADGSDLTRLTHDVGFAGRPAWSPDGVRIAFDCVVEPRNWDICAIDATGTNVARLTTDPAADSGAAWSPAGGSIAFATGRYATTWWGWPPEIVVMNVDGGGVTRLGVAGYGPVWSPDASRIAFQPPSGGACDDFCNDTISIMNADGTGVRFLASGFKPSWTTTPLTRMLAPPIAWQPDLDYWGCDGRTCTFNAGESWDDESPWWDPAAIASYRWDFGDGTTGSGLIVNHTYTAYGAYTATLTVTDHDGLSGTQTRTFYVIQW